MNSPTIEADEIRREAEARVAEAGYFINSLFQNCSGANVEFRFLPSGSQVFTSLDQLELPEIPGHENLFVGVATRNGGGKKEHVIEIPALWADLDFKDIPQGEAEKRLNEFPMQPSILVGSGHGLHAYWLLKEPASSEDLSTIESLNRGLAHVLGGDPAVCDAARVMRLPGTFNFKYDPARAVKILSIEPDRQYLLSDFEEILPGIPVSNRNRPMTEDRDEKIRDGKRNVTLTSLAGTMRRRGLSGDGIEAALLAENTARCEPALAPEEVRSIARSIERYAPAASTASVEAHLTDLGNAQRFAIQHAGRVRFCHPWKSWLVWTGQRWERDQAGAAVRLAKETVQEIYGSASRIRDEDARKSLVSHALRSESAGKIQAMLDLAKSEPGIPIMPEDLDRDPWAFNCANGTINLKTGELLPHRAEDLITHLAPVKYDPQAECPLFMRFLIRIMMEDPELITYLQQVFGYSLTGSTKEQCFFVHHGAGNNGKSTLRETIAEAMGSYATQTPVETFLVKRQEGIPNDVAALKGTRFVSGMETEQGRRLAESLIKQLTGGDTVSARFLHGEFFTFRPEFKIHIATNHKPVIQGTDHAIWRRVRLIPYTVQIPKNEQDKDLPEKLRAELPGILRWVVEGCLRWQAEGLESPEQVETATSGYRAEMDSIARFIEECCLTGPEEREAAGKLYARFKKWCEEAGEKPVSQTIFGERLNEMGYPKERNRSASSRRFERCGLRLLDAFESLESETLGGK